MVIFPISCYAGYLSFGKDAPSFIAARPPLDDTSDIPMTIAQVGLIFGLTISICLRINGLVDTIQSILVQPFLESFTSKEISPQTSDMTKIRKWVLNVISISIPFVCSLLITNNVISVISLISSLLCSYVIIIAPGKLTRPHESPSSKHSQN